MKEPLKLGNTAIDHEFKHYPETSSGKHWHQECIDNIKRIRSTFLLLSLLRQMSGLEHDAPHGSHAGSLTWARQIPDTLAWLSYDYTIATTARHMLFPPPGPHSQKICGDCFTVWITNIRDDWDDCLRGISNVAFGVALVEPLALREFSSFQHALNCLLKYDP